ncbi:MAG: FAD binding domain-containing protein [Bacteroidota bacterium]
MIEFILNERVVKTGFLPTTVLLDFLRKEKRLTGTKEGCREGDCGACTILLGVMDGNNIYYKSVNSCLIPLGDVHGKHVVTVEGITPPASGKHGTLELTAIQAALVDQGGTQCGFCTPGFVVSLTGYFLNNTSLNFYDAVESLGGNVCRCTGYAGIKRAVEQSILFFEKEKLEKKTQLENLVTLNFIPEYFCGIKEQLKKIHPGKLASKKKSNILIAGGTDLYVQRWESLVRSESELISGNQKLSGIFIKNKLIKIGAATTIEEIKSSLLLKKHFPLWNSYLNLFGSLPIRNRATVGGNIVNASPIGDVTNVLLALNAFVHLNGGKKKRSIPLKNFYKGYKTLDKKTDEIVESVSFSLPSKKSFFNFEKVSKRRYLDIASVNSSAYIETRRGKISTAHISAGGVAPIPAYLSRTCDYLIGKIITTEAVVEAASIAMGEILPISDARGSAEYKRLLLRQLLYAHFIKFFPQQIDLEKLF